MEILNSNIAVTNEVKQKKKNLRIVRRKYTEYIGQVIKGYVNKLIGYKDWSGGKGSYDHLQKT